MAQRLRGRFGYPKDDPFKVTLHPDKLDEPLHWRKPRRVFVNSMSDTFHEEVPEAYIDRVLAVAALAPRHTFLFLTKRPDRMRDYITTPGRPFSVQRAMDASIVDSKSNGVERWLPAPGFEGLYEVSDMGRVRRSDGSKKGRRNPEGVLSDRPCRGYITVSLSRGGVVTQIRVQRLVLMAFAGPPPSARHDARHINGDSSDNRLWNLAWGTRKQNMADAVRHGTAGVWMKGRTKFPPAEVREIRAEREAGRKLSEIAAKHDASKQRISKICRGEACKLPRIAWPLPNVWLGVSVENQQTADERIPLLLQTPAAVRFVSYEPALGPVDFEAAFSVYDKHGEPSSPRCNPDGSPAIGQVICGAETGPGARPMDLDWARKVRDDCAEAGIPYFFKRDSDGNRKLDGKMHEEIPA